MWEFGTILIKLTISSQSHVLVSTSQKKISGKTLLFGVNCSKPVKTTHYLKKVEKLSVDLQLQQDLRALEAQQCIICQEKLITDMVPN